MTIASRLSPGDFEVLCRTPLFEGLPQQSVADLLDGAAVRSYPDDTLLFSAGDRAECFFVVVEGAVRLFALDEDGSESIIEIVSAGASFAEAAMFASGRFPVNAEVLAGARLVRIDAATFLRRLAEDNASALKMLASVGHWQLRLMGELYQLKAQTPAQRLAWYILQFTDVEAGAVTVRLPYRKSLIASRIGITPESLSRAIARLGEIGVRSRGNQVTIDDVERLNRFCRK
jgi:CRP/FNR family transcriptional regulator, dissimilatory nitrate respiration regulator